MAKKLTPEELIYLTLRDLVDGKIWPVFEPQASEGVTLPSIVYGSQGASSVSTFQPSVKTQVIRVFARHRRYSGVCELTEQIYEAITKTGRLRSVTGFDDSFEEGLEFYQRSITVEITR